MTIRKHTEDKDLRGYRMGKAKVEQKRKCAIDFSFDS